MVTSVLVLLVDEDEYPNAIKYIDPCVALASIALIVMSSVPLGQRVSGILFQSFPDHMSVAKLKQDIMLNFDEDVADIHEFHVWSLDHSEVVGTAHVIYTNQEVSV